MARLWSSGAELNATTAGVETSGAVASTTSISTSTIRTGTYAYRSNPTGVSAGVIQNVYLSAATQGAYYYRFYINVATIPASTVKIIDIGRFNAGFESNVAIRITSTGTLQLFNTEDNAQVGSDSSAISTNTWYLVELKVDTTTLASTSVDARINGSSFASGTINLADANDRFQMGGASAVAMDIFFDDIAVNDSSGSFQNSYAGAGEVRHLLPDSAGDNNAFTIQVGGTAGSSNNFTRVKEVTPDDVTSYNADVTSGDIDDFNLAATPAGIGSSDTINVVAVGVRYNAAVAAAEAAFVLRVKASSGGTVEESSAITPTSTTWVTNANAAPRNYALTLYDLPGASTTAWTKADLDAAQIGYRISTTNTNAAEISTLWMLVDSTPAAGGSSVSIGYRSLLGVGI